MAIRKGIDFLSLDEERDLIRRAKAGDADAMERIFQQYKPLIVAECRQSKSLEIHDDLYCIGCAALLIAVNQFDESRGVKFAAWAKGKIHGDIWTEFRRQRKNWNRERSIEGMTNRSYSDNGATEKSAVDITALANDKDDYAAADARMIVLPALAILSDREKEIVLAVSCGGYGIVDVAKWFDISPQRTGKIYRTAIEKMRLFIEGKALKKQRGRPRKNALPCLPRL